MRPLLYVCAPWRRRTTESMRLVALTTQRALKLGWVPIFAPLLFQLARADGLPMLDDELAHERAIALDCDRAIILRCDGFVVVREGAALSEGMRRDLDVWAPLLRPTFDGRLAIERAEVYARKHAALLKEKGKRGTPIFAKTLPILGQINAIERAEHEVAKKLAPWSARAQIKPDEPKEKHRG